MSKVGTKYICFCALGTGCWSPVQKSQVYDQPNPVCISPLIISGFHKYQDTHFE